MYFHLLLFYSFTDKSKIQRSVLYFAVIYWINCWVAPKLSDRITYGVLTEIPEWVTTNGLPSATLMYLLPSWDLAFWRLLESGYHMDSPSSYTVFTEDLAGPVADRILPCVDGYLSQFYSNLMLCLFLEHIWYGAHFIVALQVRHTFDFPGPPTLIIFSD